MKKMHNERVKNIAAKLFFITGIFYLSAIFVGGQIPKTSTKETPIRTINIISEPSAIVWLDDIRFGKTDKTGKLVIKTVFAGKHTLRVRADGFKETTKPIPANQEGDVSIPLTKTTDEAELKFQEAEKLSFVDRDKAVEAYQKAVKLRPKFPEAYLAMARVLSETGDLEEALKAVKQAQKLRLNYAEATAVEARILKESGEEEKAIAAFKRSITEGKGAQPEANAGLGLLYKEKAEGFGASGDFENETANYLESEKYLQKALSQLSGAPDSIVIYQLLGLIYERQKQFTDAIAVYEEFLRLFPDSSEATAVRSYIVQIKKQMNEK
ncbi:MAG TPA: tetratricopeptide repeat protein [Pyrinomonadaceae bacterium]|nr:tetratricopeptide repeat protein [Pyrinomonadaceae bacterium]